MGQKSGFLFKLASHDSDVYKLSSKPASNAGVVFSFLTLAGLAVYAVFLGYQNWTEVQTEVSVLPVESSTCSKALFTCKDKKGCLAAAVGPETIKKAASGVLNENITTVSQDGTINMYLCAGGLEGVHIGPSNDVLSLDDGEFQPNTAVYNPTIDFAFIATLTSPAKVIKADLGTMSRTAALKLQFGENMAQTSVLVGQIMFVGLQTGQVVKIDVSGSGTTPPSRVSSIDLGGPVVSSTKDPSGTLGLFGVAPSGPDVYGKIVEVDLTTMTQTRNITLQVTGSPSVLVEGQGHIFVGFSALGSVVPSPRGPFIQKIQISDFSRKGNLSLNAAPPFGDEYVTSGYASGNFAVFGTTRINDGQPANIITVNMPSLVVTRINKLFGGEQSVVSIMKVVINNVPYGFFAINSSPPRVIKYNMVSMNRVSFRDIVAVGPNTVPSISLALQDSDKYLYFGGGNAKAPGRIKRYPPDLGLSEKWGYIKVTGSSNVESNQVRIPPAPLLSEASVFLTTTQYINSTIQLKIGLNAPLTPPITLYPCELNTQERCCVVNGAPLRGIITQSFLYSWIAYVGAVGGFAGILMSVLGPFVGVFRDKTDSPV